LGKERLDERKTGAPSESWPIYTVGKRRSAEMTINTNPLEKKNENRAQSDDSAKVSGP